MKFLSKMFAPAVGQTIKGITEGVGSLALNIRSAITGELPANVRAKLEELAQRGEQLAQAGQIEVNKIEAGHKSIFVAGWRPFIGWICGISLGWNYIAHPVLLWIAALTNITTTPPKLSMTELFPVVLGMLGLGAYRSYEKKHGVESNR